jgi:translation initiation factor 2 beta subunit (eIF-2beta)/eIF-5
MIKLFEFLLHGCWHQWERIDDVLVTHKITDSYGELDEFRVRTYTLQCKKCGSLTHYKVSYK